MFLVTDDIAIRIRGLGKKYAIGRAQGQYLTLRDCGTIKKVILIFVYVILSKEQQKMAKKKFNPEDVIGKPYARGLLPYGGGVTRGKISFAVSEEEHLDGLKRLKSIIP